MEPVTQRGSREIAHQKPLNMGMGQNDTLEQYNLYPIIIELWIKHLQTVPDANVVQPATKEFVHDNSQKQFPPNQTWSNCV